MAAVISIVDDDKAVREGLQRMLRAHGFDAAAFASAGELLASDERHHTACLILDVRMPDMTGIALHDYLVAQGCLVPTILMTACPTTGERERAIAAGAVSYLAKPLSEHLLLDTVRDALNETAAAATPWPAVSRN